MMTKTLLIACCERRIRTFTRNLATKQSLNESSLWSTPIWRLSCSPHPRDKRAWLPVSSPHSISKHFHLSNKDITNIYTVHPILQNYL